MKYKYSSPDPDILISIVSLVSDVHPTDRVWKSNSLINIRQHFSRLQTTTQTWSPLPGVFVFQLNRLMPFSQKRWLLPSPIVGQSDIYRYTVQPTPSATGLLMGPVLRSGWWSPIGEWTPKFLVWSKQLEKWWSLEGDLHKEHDCIRAKVCSHWFTNRKIYQEIFRGDQDDDHYRKFHFRKIEKHIIFNSIVAFYYLSRLNPSKWTHNDIMPSCMLIMLRVHRLWFSEFSTC